MDETVLCRLQNVAISPNELGDRSNFDSLYKNWGRLGNQDERRKEILSVQKSNRQSKIDKLRGILDLVEAVEETADLNSENKAYYRPTIYVAGFMKVPSYGEVLMKSEWMIEKPYDFETNWLVVPVPKGTRTLVVARNGITRLYNKYGFLMFECRTALPGGNPCDPKSKSNCCVLDCFYQKKGNVLYVLDILAWNSQPMTDGELEFRDYWLRSQFFELDSIRVLSKKNHLSFQLLPKVSCATEFFTTFMKKIHFDKDCVALDGFLFFHKKAHYISGDTPLVGWLFAFMVPEIFGRDIVVNPAYLIQKPDNYTNQADFIIDFNTKLDKKSKARAKTYSTRRTTESHKVRHKELKSKHKRYDMSETELMEAEIVPDTTDKMAFLQAESAASMDA